jgi:hypothetical protein
VAARVIPFARRRPDATALAAKIRAIQKANDLFWSRPGPHLIQAGLAFAELKKATQRARAKQPRPQRKAKHALRDQRIRVAFALGEKPKQIAAREGISAPQVRRILKPAN